jgi:hypothetical protein
MYGALISSVTVGAGGAASINFTSIPQTYTDLILVVSGRSTVSGVGDTAKIAINGSTATFTSKVLEGSGASVSSANTTYQTGGIVGSTSTTNTFSNFSIHLLNYTGATNKSWSVDSVTENNATTAYQDLVAGVWATTSAITSISLTLVVGPNFAQYSTAYLYGLTKGSGGATVS